MVEQELEELQKQVKEHLTKKRFYHTVGVRYTAAAMAMALDPDLIEKASIGGILHDCAKCFTDQEIIKECKKNAVSCTQTERNNPSLLHAKLGVCYAKKYYAITDEEILSAIRFHTTGKPDMTLLEKILFTADYIEPHRNQIPGLTKIRQLAFSNIDEAVYEILKNTLDYLNETGKGEDQTLDSMTINAYEYYKQLTHHN